MAEKWIWPSLFEGTDAVDEYTLLQTPGGAKRLRQHHREFIREEDFAWLASHGVNAVRIPVGYWIFDGDEPYISAISRLDWAMKMAKKHQLQVLISMHGAPGSQNGHDHSGRIGPVEWHSTRHHRELTIDVLERLAVRYKSNEWLWGIELLNEPRFSLTQFRVRKFQRQAYERLRHVARPGTHIVFHDGFTPRLMNGALWGNAAFPVVMDIHWYHFAFWAHRWTPVQWYYRLVDWHGALVRRLTRSQPIIIGEWSMVISAEAFRRYPESTHQAMMDEHARRQMRAYDSALGWFYWTYRTEGRGLWNFRSLVEDGRITLD